MSPRFIDVFAGIGGLALGFERAGWDCVAHIENDPACQTILEKHWPTVPLYGDVTDVRPDELPRADAFIGGFPCQDVSVAGRREGLAGDRSGLWYQFYRLTATLAPRWVLIENVPGLLSSNEGRDFAVVLSGLAELGYGWSYRVLDSQYFGVAQRRRRVFVVGHIGGRCPPEILFEPESLSRDPAPGTTEGSGAAAPTAPGAAGPYWDGGEVSDTLDRSMLGKGQMMPEKRRFPVIVEDAYTVTPESGQGSDLVVRPTDKASALSATDAKLHERGTRVLQPVYRKAQRAHHADDCERWEHGHRADTLDAGGHSPRTAHAVVSPVPRRLTPRECERLQGFPDDWTAGVSNSMRYRQLGNAVTVNVAEWIARRMRRAHEQTVS